MKKLFAPAALTVAMLAAGGQAFAKDVSAQAVLDNYANIAQAKYEDSLNTAMDLQSSIEKLLANPSDATLKAAREAWIAARVPYQQSEVYRFGNAIVDDWEGKVNAWPLDEGLIDYVDASSYGEESDENPAYAANVIANAKLNVGGVEIDATTITPALIAEQLQEVDGVEANVASGYHAIEFLLWGQDLNGNEKGAGNRPATDFDVNNCTGGNCDRRRDYLQAATTLMISDLKEMVANWEADGAARKDLMAKGEKGGLSTMLTGMGSLAYGELAGERTKLGLMLHDPEEEHDCFSDNTHWSHFYDAKGIMNVYEGSYTRVNGQVVSGPSLSDLVAAKAPELDKEMQMKLKKTQDAMQVMADRGEAGETFDVLIGAGNTEGNQIVQNAVDGLVDETKTIEKIIGALDLDGIELEGSDSLDNPSLVSN
ncbi:imelysin family protein [Aliamphritea spongicola]|uniref:imelysin family protein n=1 Tax=Aliamphritea spongicola TaxID=707589 RepID=UPI00196ACACF|nr:imelysin family protein [Aliamphritea spongicola]MBN3562199.1 peptidase [Aliamphritea spongicola]